MDGLLTPPQSERCAHLPVLRHQLADLLPMETPLQPGPAPQLGSTRAAAPPATPVHLGTGARSRGAPRPGAVPPVRQGQPASAAPGGCAAMRRTLGSSWAPGLGPAWAVARAAGDGHVAQPCGCATLRQGEDGPRCGAGRGAAIRRSVTLQPLPRRRLPCAPCAGDVGDGRRPSGLSPAGSPPHTPASRS